MDEEQLFEGVTKLMLIGRGMLHHKFTAIAWSLLIEGTCSFLVTSVHVGVLLVYLLTVTLRDNNQKTLFHPGRN